MSFHRPFESSALQIFLFRRAKIYFIFLDTRSYFIAQRKTADSCNYVICAKCYKPCILCYTVLLKREDTLYSGCRLVLPSRVLPCIAPFCFVYTFGYFQHILFQ